MSAPVIIALTLALLAASAITLFGVVVGAFITYRLVKGKPPVPDFPRRRSVEVVEASGKEQPKVRLPIVKA